MTATDPAPNQLGALLDILPDAVLMVDAGQHIVYANHAVRALLGYAPHELCGAALAMLVPSAQRERHEAMVAAYQRGGAPMPMASRPVLHAVHRDGQSVPVGVGQPSLLISELTVGGTRAG